MTDQEIIKRQWLEALGAGWPFEVWDHGNYDEKYVMFLSKNTKYSKNAIYFCQIYSAALDEIFINGVDHYYENYRPLSTPLDFLCGEAKKIQIDENGCFIFLNEDEGIVNHWAIWLNCPEGLKGKIFKIPDDWRPK